MKKAGKIVAYLVVLALITGLFSGIGFAKAPETEVKAATNTFNILEIVPDTSMATFGYLVAGYEPQSVLANANDSDFIGYLSDNNLGSLVYKTDNPHEVDHYASTNFFVERVLKRAYGSAGDTWNVSVTVKTPAQLNSNSSAIDSANMIIINETVPDELKVSGVTSASFGTVDDFGTSVALKIFKKIAGIGSDPIPYLIDYNIYTNTPLISDVRSIIESDYPTAYCGYVRADEVDVLGVGGGDTAYVDDGSYSYSGSNRNSYKLYKLLATMDPATLYGLYFNNTDGSYGIDNNLNLIYVYHRAGNKNPSRYNLGGEASAWTDALFRPNYMATTGSGLAANATLLTNMGWFETFSNAEDYKIIGGEDGKGIVYRSSDSFFYLMKCGTGALETTSTTPTTTETTPTPTPSFTVNVNDNGLTDTRTITTLEHLTNLVKTYAVRKENSTISKTNFEKYCSDFDINVSYIETISYNVSATIPQGDKSYTITLDEVNGLPIYKEFLADVGVPQATVNTVTSVPVSDNLYHDGWLIDKVRTVFGNGPAGAIKSCVQNKDSSGNLISYTVSANTFLTQDYVINSVDSYKVFLTALGVDSSTVAGINSIPVWKDNANAFKNGINNTFGWEYANMINSSSYTYLDGWYFDDGTEADSLDMTSLDSQRTFLRDNLNCSENLADLDADSLKGLLTGKYAVTSNAGGWTVTDNNATPTTVEPATSGDVEDKITYLIKSYHGTASKNDYHTYRLLVVTQENVSSTINRTLVSNMVQYAHSKGKGLAGGVVVECMSRHQFDNINDDLDSTYDAICVDDATKLNSVGAAKFSDSNYHGRKPAFTKNGLVGAFENAFDSSSTFGVNYTKLPQEYYSYFRPSFQDENGIGSYKGITTNEVAGNVNYINNSLPSSDPNSHPNRTLDFNFTVKGNSTYSATLYVDKNRNDKYDADEAKALTSTWTGKTYVGSVPLDDILGKDFVGGFGWKLVITDTATGGKSICKVGYSACRKEGEGKQTIRILQIYPTDYKDYYSFDGYDNDKTWSNPLLILPTKDEINRAKTTKAKGDITEYNPNDLSSGESGKGFKGIWSYLDDCLQVDVVTSYNIEGSGSGKDSTKKRVATVDTTQRVQFTEGNKRFGIIKNSSILYYYLAKLDDFDIDVTRYSVYGFGNAVANNQIIYNEKTNKLGMANGGNVKNSDNSTRYVYSPSALGLGTDTSWTNPSAGWDDPALKKYLVDDTTKKIYGERLPKTLWTTDSDGAVTKIVYYGTNMTVNVGGTNTLVTGNVVKELADFDLLMIGFGNSMDYMEPDKAVPLLVKYFHNNGPAFVGNGAVSVNGNNNLGKAIRSYLGMTENKTNGVLSNGAFVDTYVNAEYDPTVMVTNNTLFSHYPYRVEHYMKATAGNVQPYKLNLSDSSIVSSFVRYNQNNSTAISVWGDVDDNYYLYKKGSITFCGFGSVYPEQNLKQVGGIMTMAETVMIVNALVTTSRYASGGKTKDPFMNCLDVDSSITKTEISGLEDDEKDDEADKKYDFYDSVYTDYDVYDVALYKNKDIFANAVNSEGSGKATLTVPSGFTDAAGETRWIPYYIKMPTNTCYLEICTLGDASIPLTLYRYTVNEGTATYSPMTAEGGRYHIEEKGNYYIAVPLKSTASAYSGKSGLGFSFDKSDSATTAQNIDSFSIKLVLYSGDKEAEKHTVTMVRRVLYPVK